MKNFDETEVYKKKIRVENEFKEDKSFALLFNKANYQPGDTLKVTVKLYNGYKEVTENSKFKFKLLVNDKTLENGAANTLETNDIPLTFVLSDSSPDKYILRVWDYDISTDFTVPFHTQIHVDFFPEGGSCLVDEPGTIAFKAVSDKGEPVEVGGNVIDETGSEYANVKTDYLGMGKFMLAPQKDKNYYFKITNPKGFDQKYLLPAAKINTWAIEAQGTKNKIFVKIRNNVSADDTCLLMLAIRGYHFYFKLITSDEKSVFAIPTDSLPAGIGVLTLLNKKNMPVSERLVFINHDRFVESAISTQDSQYLARDLVKLKVHLNKENIDLSAGQYSLTVYDGMFGASEQLDEPNIISYNYLAPEIKGIILHPNYYFASRSKQVEYHLDLLLLTQGWRNYSYLSNSIITDTLKVPINKEIVSGTLLKKRFNGQEIPIEGEILVYFAGASQKITTDKNGRFRFYPEYSTRSTSSILLSAGKKNNTDEILIKLDNDGFEDKLSKNLVLFNDTNAIQKTRVKTENEKKDYTLLSNRNVWIEEVKIEAKKPQTFAETEVEMMKDYYSHATKCPPDLLKSAINLEDVLNAMGYYCVEKSDETYILHAGVEKKFKVIIDGFKEIRPQDALDALIEYKPAYIKELRVISGMEASLYFPNSRMTWNYVVVYILTDQDALWNSFEKVDNTPNSISIDGLQVVKEFYSPLYLTKEEKESPTPDLRKTLYWNPNVVIDSAGNAEISFYNADHYTKINCVLEGITDSGVPVHAETHYNISSTKE